MKRSIWPFAGTEEGGELAAYAGAIAVNKHPFFPLDWLC